MEKKLVAKSVTKAIQWDGENETLLAIARDFIVQKIPSPIPTIVVWDKKGDRHYVACNDWLIVVGEDVYSMADQLVKQLFDEQTEFAVLVDEEPVEQPKKKGKK